MNLNDHTNEHCRTIIHLDLDCFYAQVEMLKKPELKNLPLGIQQQNIVVTSNYIAREYGIKKCMLLSDALQLCPTLVLANGEHLEDYRSMSYKVTGLLEKSFTETVERAGIDENYIDVTKLVDERIKNLSMDVKVIGNVFGSTENLCQCGCQLRMKIGCLIASEMRKLIYEELGLTSCAGIAHNKLLAKIVGSTHKPNQQTVLFPDNALGLLLSLDSVKGIPGIGNTTAEILRNNSIKEVKDLQNIKISELTNLFGSEKAKFLQNLSYGIDNTPVKRSGKPNTIGLEESCKYICAEKEVRQKLTELLKRLLVQVEADGRIPRTIKLTVRTLDTTTKLSRRETKQTNINPRFFTSSMTNATNVENILVILMNLFRKLVQVRKPFHITLLGVCLNKFNEPINFKHSIASFLRKDLEVQSVTNIENRNTFESSPESAGPSPLSCKELSDTESEPTPKRKKLHVFKRELMNHETGESPSKLTVTNLNINSEKPDDSQNVECPPYADKAVFDALPLDVQQEVWSEYRRSKSEGSALGIRTKRMKTNNLLNYFVKK